MKDTKNETMGMRIRNRRIALGMTQELLAERMCIPKVTVSAYENDRVDIKASTILELSRQLGLTPNVLLLGGQVFDDEGESAYQENVMSMIAKIKNPMAKKIIAVEISALVHEV